MKKKFSFFFLFLFLLITGLNIHIRLFPAYFPQLKKQAEQTVENRILEEAAAQVEEQFPDFNPVIKSKIIRELYEQRKKETSDLKDQIAKEHSRLKDRFQDAKGQTYLLELDPYSWMRATRLILKNGYPGEERVGQKAFDGYMLAPHGAEISPAPFIFYVASFIYRASSFFFDDLALEKVIFYLPILFLLFLFIALYLFCRHFFSQITGVLALIFVGFSPILIARSTAGWFDNDILNILFALLIIWSLAAAFKAKTVIRNIFLSLAASFCLALYAYTWVGWWFIYLVIFAFFAYVLLNTLSLHYKDVPRLRSQAFPYLISLFAFTAGSLIFCKLIAGIEPLSHTFNALCENLGLGKSLASSIWPNTYYTVQELQPGNFLDIPISLGGWLIFILALVSSLWVYLRYKRTDKGDIVVLLVFWLFSMSFASLKGSRFTLLLCLPVGVFLSMGIDKALGNIIGRITSSKEKKVKIALFLAATFILYFFVGSSVNRGFALAKEIYPAFNDDWQGFLGKLKSSTEKDAVINAWWDYGNWFKEVADRRVIFDGQTQNRPLAYWMAKALLTDDEEEAIRVLRMLNNSSDKLFEEINDFLDDDFRSLGLLERLLKAEEDIDDIFKDYDLSPELESKIKDTIFFKQPSPAYLVLDKSMLNKMPSISFLGNWSFARAYTMKHRGEPKDVVIAGLQSIFRLDLKRAEAIYKEVTLSQTDTETSEVLSSRFMFDSHLAKGYQEGGLVYFDNGAILNLEELTAKIFLPRRTSYDKIKYVFFFDQEDLIYREYEDAAEEWCGLFYREDLPEQEDLEEEAKGPRDEGYRCIALTKELGQSLFVRLYFTRAKGLQHFEPFIIDNDSGLFAFKIKWEAD